MTISRMQQPRQMYGLGSLVKSVTKGVKSAVSGVKDLVKSDLGKAAILGAGLYGLGGAKFLGGSGIFSAGQGLSRFANLANLPGAISGALGLGVPEGEKPTLGQFGKVFGIGALGGAALEALTASGASEEELENIRDPETLKGYLRRGYKQLNPGAKPEQIEEFVTANTREYAANGGRIGYQDGTPKEGIETLTPMKKPGSDVQYVRDMIKSLDGFAQLIAQEGNLDRKTFQGHMDLFEDFRQRNDIDAMPAYTYLQRRVQELNPEVAKMIYITQEDNPNKTNIEKPKMAYGGRIGFQQGGNFDFNQFLQDRTREAMQVEGIGQAIRPVVESNVRAQAARDLSQAARGGGIESFLRGKLGSGIIPGMSAMQSPMSGTSAFGRQQVLDALTKAYMKPYSMPTGSAYDQMRFAQPGQSGSFVEMEGGQFGDGMGIVIDGKRYATEQEAIDDVGAERYSMFYADGGRIGYAYGDRAEDNAMQASSAMGLPLNQNPAGVTELDLRETGGFIPPVGVKEKADDIPAMLSNNEFVFTADAVRGMGDGDVNKGAQRMYDMMKKLENGGRV